VRSTGWADVARWAGVLACMLLVASVAASNANASDGFGIEHYDLTANEEHGSTDTQAGSHPYALTAEVALEPNAHNTGADEVKNLDFELPLGLIIDPAAVPQSNAVGTAQVSVAGNIVSDTVYNLAPAPGEFARLDFTLEDVSVIAIISVRTGSGYGMTLSIQDLPQVKIESLKLTLGGLSKSTLLTLPTACAATMQTLQGESWGGETASSSASFPQMTDCGRLPFDPGLSVTPNVTQAGEPSGYQVQLTVPQNESPEGLVTAQPRNASVTLPAGTSLSLLSMSGSTGCEEAQFALDSDEPSTCASDSKIGLVKITTPLLGHPLEGAVFLAIPYVNPLGALIAFYLVAEDPVSGVKIKLVGQLALNPATGQPTLTFPDLPQLPISEISVDLFGGERALLANPPSCGPATSTGELAPWSAGGEVTVSSSFAVSWNGIGAGCPSPLPFEPSLNAETLSTSAGSYSPFILAVSRGNRQQPLSGLLVQLPTGLQWMLGSVPLCEEPQASQGTCQSNSQIGTAIIRVGPANRSASFTGWVYLTEGYDGAQYGLSIALNAMAGPLDLGVLVLRAAVAQDQSTGALTITSNPLPQIIDGVPLQTRALEMEIDRSEFVLNPTICESRQITATVEGAQGTSVQVSNPFTVQGCQNPPATQDAPTSTEEPAGSAGSTDSPPKASTPKLLLSQVGEKLSGDHLLVTFTTLANGSVTVTGRGIRKCTKKLSAGTNKVTITLSRRGIYDRRHHRRFKLELIFKFADGSMNQKITFKL
jgi:hypothetical protein